MIRVNSKQARILADILDEGQDVQSPGVEITQEDHRVRASTITVHRLDRTGKVYHVDKIKPNGDHVGANQ